MTSNNNRILYIDYLKVLGLFLIILAHVCNNPYIFQIRNFDVPLMVMISGVLSIESYRKSISKNNSIIKYYWKRIERLCIPTWIFLTIFFILSYVATMLTGKNFYTFGTVVRSYLLIDGIGYVWVIRVYLLCALITPIIVYLNNKISNSIIKVCILAVIYILYELMIYFNFNKYNFFLEYIIAYIIPYRNNIYFRYDI